MAEPFENMVNKKRHTFIHITWLFIIYILPITVEAILYDTRAVSFQLVTLVTYVKYLNSDLIINIWKKKNRNGKRERIIRLNQRFQNRK